MLPFFRFSVGKDLALLQAEALTCAKELANVPNVCWQSVFLFLSVHSTVYFQHGTERIISLTNLMLSR